jgi:hypothetical protein
LVEVEGDIEEVEKKKRKLDLGKGEGDNEEVEKKKRKLKEIMKK